jgi:hypothetical protein
MASGIYTIFKTNLMNKAINLDTDSIYCCLYDNTHVFTASDVTYVTTNELATAGGYTRGEVAGNLLGSTTISASTPVTTIKWDAADIAWTAATFSAYHAVLWDATVGATNNLIANIDFGGVKTVAAGTFTIQWDALGIISLA